MAGTPIRSSMRGGRSRRAMADMAVDAVIAVLEGREAGHRVV